MIASTFPIGNIILPDPIEVASLGFDGRLQKHYIDLDWNYTGKGWHCGGYVGNCLGRHSYPGAR
jgi:hypothetical protein